MAEVLPHQMSAGPGFSPFVGAQVLESIAMGMYDDPLVIYREYIQNSADAIDVAVGRGIMGWNEGCISIDVSGKQRSVTIEDNGVGVPAEQAAQVLGDLGKSTKCDSGQRGFRGIGRLGGLGYCEMVSFETRSSRSEPVVAVEWDTVHLQRLLQSRGSELSITEAVEQICTVKYRAARKAEPGHFFRVTLLNIHRFHDDILMDIKRVRSYLSQIAPVPYDSECFSFGGQLRDYFGEIRGYREYKIGVNGEQLFRPYQDTVRVSKNGCDTIKGIELFQFTNGNGRRLALGWYAKTGLVGVLPRELGVRGIRVRQGNIQVAGEHFLTEYFSEGRFSKWHIGEVHIADGCIKPNGRRDGFEQSPEYESFLEYSYLLGQHLSELCRRASKERSARRIAGRALEDVERLLSSNAAVVDDEQADGIARRIDELTAKLDHIMGEYSLSQDYRQQLYSVKRKAKCRNRSASIGECLDGRTLRHKGKKELLCEVCREILASYSATNSAVELIRAVTEPYLKPGAKRGSRIAT